MTETIKLEKTRNRPDGDGSENKKAKVIDRVFTQVGFDRLFLDQPEDFKKPHCSISAPSPMILHIDDDEDLVDVVTARFKSQGFRVAGAHDGVSGIQEALLLPADCIVLDYDMPNGRGDTVIMALKNEEATKDIPILVLSAMSNDELRLKLLGMGAACFMTKPFNFDELNAEVSRLIDTNA